LPHSHRLAIADAVTRLLSHFGTTDEPHGVRQAIAQDWVDDLEEFTLPQVQWAAREWRRIYATRPTIAEIRKLAIQAQRDDVDQLALENKKSHELSATTIRLWSQPDNPDDHRTWQQRRNDAIAAQEARYDRAAQWRRENPNWAEKKPPTTARDLAEPRSPLASYPDDPT
jgi:hypothetical protein